MNMMNKNGFSFVEILVTVVITSLVMAGAYTALSSGEASWFTTEAGIQVQENLRKALDQITEELRQTKFSKATLVQDAGVNATDSITFQIPVVCHTGDNFLDGAGDIAHWGATTQWGCRTASCMDADDDCTTLDYKSIRYSIASGNLLVRSVLNSSDAVILQSTIARNIRDFQLVMPNATSPLAITIKGEVASVLNRGVVVTVQSNVDLRNN